MEYSFLRSAIEALLSPAFAADIVRTEGFFAAAVSGLLRIWTNADCCPAGKHEFRQVRGQVSKRGWCFAGGGAGGRALRFQTYLPCVV